MYDRRVIPTSSDTNNGFKTNAKDIRSEIPAFFRHKSILYDIFYTSWLWTDKWLIKFPYVLSVYKILIVSAFIQP